MNSRELEQLMNNYSLDQSKEISLFDAYNRFIGEKKEISTRIDTSK